MTDDEDLSELDRKVRLAKRDLPLPKGAIDITDQFLRTYSMTQELATTTATAVPTPKAVYNFESKLIKVKGGQLYLRVRDRLAWLRTEHPEAHIVTEIVQYLPDSQMWVIKATVTIRLADGTIALSTGHGQETEADFPAGALEKAETKAIGRAIAALGFGTEQALDYDEGDRVVDSPVPARSNGNNFKVIRPEDLRENVIALLNNDPEGKAKLDAANKANVGEMTDAQLTELQKWLLVRAHKQQQQQPQA